MLPFLLFFTFSSIVTACDLTTNADQWTSVRAHHMFMYATEQAQVSTNSFCQSDDFFGSLISIDSRVNLAKQSKVKNTVTKSQDKLIKSCKTDRKEVKGCISYCDDPKVQQIVIEGAIQNGSLPLDVAMEIQKALGNQKDWNVSVLQVDLANNECVINYGYFNDVNFCVMILQIQTTGFPYRLFIQASKDFL